MTENMGAVRRNAGWKWSWARISAAVQAVFKGESVQKKNSCRDVFTISFSRDEVRLLSAAVLPCTNGNFLQIGNLDDRAGLKQKIRLAMRLVLETIE